MGRGIAEAVVFMHEHLAETLAILRPRFAQLPETVLANAFDAYNAYNKASTLPPAITEAARRNSEDFQVEGGITKPEEKLASFDGRYTDEFIR